jgi:hypothetical protein
VVLTEPQASLVARLDSEKQAVETVYLLAHGADIRLQWQTGQATSLTALEARVTHLTESTAGTSHSQHPTFLQGQDTALRSSVTELQQGLTQLSTTQQGDMKRLVSCSKD